MTITRLCQIAEFDLRNRRYMSSKADERLQKLDEVLQCMPHELVRLIRNYDLRPRHRFRVEPSVDSKIVTLSEDQTEFCLMQYSGYVGVRGEYSFASAALHWSIKVPLGTEAWIGIVSLNSTRQKSFDFGSTDTSYLYISEVGTARYYSGRAHALLCIPLSDGEVLANKPRTAAPYTTFTFAVNLEAQTLQVARNGIWTVNSLPTHLPSLAEATVYACLANSGSLTLESTDE